MHEQTKLERERIYSVIHDFCRGETMIGKACLNCPIERFNVCGDGVGGAIVPMERLRKAERAINEVITNDKL